MGPPSTSSPAAAPRRSPKVRLRRQRLESLLEELKRTLDGLGDADLVDSLSEVSTEAPEYGDSEGGGDGDRDSAPSLASDSNHETDQMFDALKSRFESPEFVQKIDEIQKSVYQNGAVELDTSWDIIKAVDLWEDNDDNGYILVKPEDAVDGIAFFVATYLLTLTKAKVGMFQYFYAGSDSIHHLVTFIPVPLGLGHDALNILALTFVHVIIIY